MEKTDNKENEKFSDFERDGYVLNNPNARWGAPEGRTRFAELNDKKSKKTRNNS